MSFNKQEHLPKGLFVISLIELWDRFTFYGTLTMLILYLTEVVHFSHGRAFAYWGVFLSVAYLLPFVGGLFADKLLGLVNMMLFGGVLMVLGCSLLACHLSNNFFFLGTAILLLGMGFLKGNISGLIGTLYKVGSPAKDVGFIYFFTCMAGGAILGPIIFGLTIKYIGWHASFIICALGNLSALLIFLAYRKHICFKSLPSHEKLRLSGALFFLICTVVLVLANFCLLYYYQYSITLLAIFCGLLLVVLISRSMRCSQIDRRKVLALLILIAITVVYYVASLQVDGTLLLFIRGHVHHQFFGWAIPVTSFSSIEPFFAMISAPILGYFWLKLTAKNKDWSVCSKVICGMLLTSTCFIFFSAATLVQFSRTLPLFFVVLGNIFLGLSDSFEVPIVMSAVSRYAPPQLLGTLMGVVFMRNAIAGYFASLVGRLSSFRGSVAKSVQGYLFSFLLVFVLCVLVTILLWVLAPHITRLFEGKNIMKKTMGGLEHANN